MSQYYQQNQIYSNLIPFENNRLIPDIQDDGSYKGSLALLNRVQNNYGIYQITDQQYLLD
jgi:hypothetical protein